MHTLARLVARTSSTLTYLLLLFKKYELLLASSTYEYDNRYFYYYSLVVFFIILRARTLVRARSLIIVEYAYSRSTLCIQLEYS